MTADFGGLSGSRAGASSPQAVSTKGFDPGRSPALQMLEASHRDQIIEDVSNIVRCAPWIARCPVRFFTPGLASELAMAVDLLACKVADLREAEGADR